MIGTGYEIPNCIYQSQVFLGALLLCSTALPVAKNRLRQSSVQVGPWEDDYKGSKQSSLTGSAEIVT